MMQKGLLNRTWMFLILFVSVSWAYGKPQSDKKHVVEKPSSREVLNKQGVVIPNRIPQKEVSRQDLLDFGFRDFDRSEFKGPGYIPQIPITNDQKDRFDERWYYIQKPSYKKLLDLFGIQKNNILNPPCMPAPGWVVPNTQARVHQGRLYVYLIHENGKEQVKEAWLQRWTLREPNEANIMPEPIFSLAKWDLDQVKDKKSILSPNDKRTEFPKTQTRQWAEKTLAEQWQPPKDVETVCVQEGVLGVDLVYRKWTHNGYTLKLIQTSRLFVFRITFPDSKLKGSAKHQEEQVKKIFAEIFPAEKTIHGQRTWTVPLRDLILKDVFTNPPQKIIDKEKQKTLLWGNLLPSSTDPNKHMWFECVSWWCDDADLVIYFPKIQNSKKYEIWESAQFPPVLYKFPSDKGWFRKYQKREKPLKQKTNF